MIYNEYRFLYYYVCIFINAYIFQILVLDDELSNCNIGFNNILMRYLGRFSICPMDFI